MLAKLSVKKPFFVLVCVIVSLILGGVSLTYMKTNLMPNFEMPYLMVITTDVGASPERVESDVTSPLESKLSSVSGVTAVQTRSSENFSMITLEFADGTNMDSALVNVSAAANEASAQLPDTAGTPFYMQMSMDMMASIYLGVSSDDMSPSELTEYVDDELVPTLERQEGVADVSTAGAVVDTVSVELNQDKIDNVNAGILGETNDQLAKSKAQIEDAESKLDTAEATLNASQSKLDAQKKEATAKFAEADETLNSALAQKSALEVQLALAQAQYDALAAQAAAETNPVTKAALEQQLAVLKAQIDGYTQSINTIETQMGSSYVDASNLKSTTLLTLAEAQNQIDDGKATIKSGRTQLEQSRQQYEGARKTATKNANIDKLVDPTTLAQLIQSQNLEMPAGYINGSGDKQWMLKVGEEYSDVKQLKNMVLTKISGVGDITLGDVADVVNLNNVGENYAKLNGQDGIILSVTKTSTSNQGDVSKAVSAAVDKVEADKSGLHVVALMDQGVYVDKYIQTILQSLLIGALLAVIVLAVFLRDIRPTIVVAFSIPFSVLLSLVIMYFWGLDLNMMTLGAMSLAIGMLVDNSIVVMENIYRLRARGLSATRAAAQGAMQVTGAIVASTLTSICVFFPFVFSSGTVRQLMVPFALTISFVLLCSLLVALTVVPSMGSRLFKNSEPKEHKWFSSLKDLYGRALGWCLGHKAPVLILAVVLLGVSGAGVVNMGITMIPETTSNQIELMIEVPDETTKAEAYDLMDVVSDRLAANDGVVDVGIADNSTTSSTMLGSLSSETDMYSGMFIAYALIDSSKIHTEGDMKALTDKVMGEFDDMDITVNNGNSMDSMTALTGDVSVEVTGPETDGTIALSEKVIKAMKSVKGYTEISNGQEDADETLHLTFDKDKVARLGTTVGQVYQQIATKLSGKTDVMTLHKSNGKNAEVKIDSSDIEPITRGNLLNTKFTVDNAADGSSKTYKLSEVADVETEPGVAVVQKEDNVHMVRVTATVADGYNITLLARELQPALEKIDVPQDYSVELAGTNQTIVDMMTQMLLLGLLGFVLIYLIMVAQFQSLLSPFIIIFTVPLAFTGGLLALIITGEQLSMMSMLGFIILMGTVVNNGIVFVDYANQLRLGGMAKRPALIATGRIRMRPILMTAATTIFAMSAMIFSQEIGASMERGMALVVAGGLLYATVMTLFVVPVIYDIFCRKPLVPVDIGSDTDMAPDDAAEYIEQLGDDARETYEYETRGMKRKRKKHGHGDHSENNKL